MPRSSSGIYVIIDYHAHTAHENRPQAQAFFADMARRYGNTPNVLYEPYNEPLDVSWAKVLKPYHEAVIDSIREYDPDNIVIVGTRNWSQQVAEAAANPDQPKQRGLHAALLREHAWPVAARRCAEGA